MLNNFSAQSQHKSLLINTLVQKKRLINSEIINIKQHIEMQHSIIFYKNSIKFDPANLVKVLITCAIKL